MTRLSACGVKGTVHPKVKDTFFRPTCCAIYASRSFGRVLLSSGDIGCGEVSLLLNMMELDETQAQQQCLFLEIFTLL